MDGTFGNLESNWRIERDVLGYCPTEEVKAAY
jgi:hypothetical protein